MKIFFLTDSNGWYEGEVVAWLALTDGEKVVAGMAQFVGIPKGRVVAVVRGDDGLFYQRELWQLRVWVAPVEEAA